MSPRAASAAAVAALLLQLEGLAAVAERRLVVAQLLIDLAGDAVDGGGVLVGCGLLVGLDGPLDILAGLCGLLGGEVDAGDGVERRAEAVVVLVAAVVVVAHLAVA